MEMSGMKIEERKGGMKIEERKGWVWVLDLPFYNQAYPAKIIRAKCKECGKENVFTNSYQFEKTIIPLSMLTEYALIYVPKTSSGFFTELRDLKIFSIPKLLASDIIYPEPFVIMCGTKHTVITTRKPANVKIPEKGTICFECLIRTMRGPDYEQGKLLIWKLGDNRENADWIWFNKCSVIGDYYSNSVKLFDHIINAEQIYIRDGTKVAFVSENTITIEADEHDTIKLNPARYIAYHPRPSEQF